jgi:neutral amino acid transport system ATP-binding protein
MIFVLLLGKSWVMALLETHALTKDFIGLKALNSVDIEIQQGELVGLIGPNGSGKTTLFNCITGFLRPTSGKVFFKEKDITSLEPHEISLRGISRTFQQIHVFSNLSILGNLMLAAQQHQGDLILSALLGTSRVRSFEKEIFERARELLEWGGLHRLKDEYAANLSYGQQKILAFLTTLMSKPELILLDEPAAAVNPTIIQGMKKRICDLNQRGQSFLVVEHNMEFVMEICSRVVVLDYGEKIFEGTPSEVVNHPKVLEAYFGN